MRSTLATLAAAIVGLQSGILVCAEDQTEIRAYATETPVAEEVTTTYVTECPCEGTPVPTWPCEDGSDCPPDDYPPDDYPPEIITVTETTTYTEPGQTIKKTKYQTRTTTQYATQPVHEPFNVTVTETSTTTRYKPTTLYETIVNNQTITDTATTTATVTDVYVSETTSISYVTLPASTITENGSTVYVPPQTLTTTITQRETVPTTIVQDRPMTVIETVISGTTSFITQTLDLTQLVTVDRAIPTTIVQPARTITTTISLPGSTIVSTITESGVTFVSTITAPGTTSVQIITQPASTFVDTVTVVQAGPTIVQTQPAPPPEIITAAPDTITVAGPPVTVTVSPPPAVCSETGLVAVSDPAGCDGRNCQIEFQEGAAVHWVNGSLDRYPPLVTVLSFVNPEARQTCITTSCNTEVFNQYYRTSLPNCARPPCPTNTIDCDCNIVVGPIALPNGQTTSVTQIGPSGWNINLGPTATARDVGLCSAGGPSCVTNQPRAFTPVAYTGDVGSTILSNNGTGAVSTRYLLPGIVDYFPAGDPLGACTTAVLNTVNVYAGMLRARQDEGQTDSKAFTWPGAALLRATEEYTATPQAVSPGPSAGPTTSAVTETTTPPSEPSPLPGTVASPSETSPAAPDTTDSPPSSAVPGEGQTPSGTSPAPSDTTDSSPSSAAPGQGQPQTLPTISPATDAAGAPSASSAVQTTSPAVTDGSAVQSSVETGTDSSEISGTIYYTNTVYYSMVQGPEGQDILNAVSSLRSGASTVAASDFGAYVTSLLGLNSTSGAAAGAVGSASGTTTGGPASATGTAPGHVSVSWALAIAGCLLALIQSM